MALSDTQRKANDKYLKTLANVSFRVKPEQAQRYKDAAAAAGKSLRAYILEALEEKILRDM